MGLTVSTTKDGVTVHSHTSAGFPVATDLTPWEAICFAEELRGRAQAHAVSDGVGISRTVISSSDHAHTFVDPSPAYTRDPEPFTEAEVQRIVCGLTL